MEQAMKLIDQLAVKLGVAVEHLWSILVKQQYAEGVTDIVLAVLFAGILIAVIIYTPKMTVHAANEYKRLADDRVKNGTGYNGSKSVSSIEEDRYDNLQISIPNYGVFIGIIAFVLTIIFIIFGIQQIINPEYFALREVLNCIKSG